MEYAITDQIKFGEQLSFSISFNGDSIAFINEPTEIDRGEELLGLVVVALVYISSGDIDCRAASTP